MQALDLAALWPQAPATQLSGTAALEPAEANAPGWQFQAALRNALQQSGPVEGVEHLGAGGPAPAGQGLQGDGEIVIVDFQAQAAG